MKSSVLVCGHGRCGSSLVMKMLDAGGFPVYGEFPSYERDDLSLDRDMATMLPRLAGMAAKVLDPQLSDWPARFDARVIWLDRNHRQQAKSQVKFLLACKPAMSIPGGAWRRLAASYGPDTKEALTIFEAANCPILRLRFEDLLTRPLESACRIAEFLDGQVDHGAAAEAVIRRSPDCAPDCRIEADGMRGIGKPGVTLERK